MVFEVEQARTFFESLFKSVAIVDEEALLTTSGRSFGRFFATNRERLRELVTRLKVRHLVDFGGFAAP